jgi:hypothetical protein
MSVDLRQLEHPSRVVMYVVGLMMGLQEKGFVEMNIALSPEAYEMYKELRAEGFRPTTQEINDCIRALRSRSASHLAENN